MSSFLELTDNLVVDAEVDFRRVQVRAVPVSWTCHRGVTWNDFVMIANGRSFFHLVVNLWHLYGPLDVAMAIATLFVAEIGE